MTFSIFLRGLAFVIFIVAILFFLIGSFATPVDFKDLGIGLAGLAIGLAAWVLATIIPVNQQVVQ
jgi:hypothetical protein